MLNNTLLWLTGLGETSHQLAVLDRDAVIVECNKAWRTMAEQMPSGTLGWRKGERFLAAFDSGRYPRIIRENISQAWAATLDEAKQASTVTYLSPCFTPQRWFTLTFKQFSANGQSYVLVTHVDVSASKHRERVRKRQLNASRRTALVAEYTDRAVMILDARARIEWVNPGFTRLMGYTLEEVIGRKPDLLNGPDSDPHTAELLGRRLAAGEAVDAEILHYTKAGQPLWIRSEIRPVKNAAGGLEHFVALEVDISDLKRAHEALTRDRELLTSIVNGLPHMIAWKSHDLVFRGCNEQYARAAGLASPEEIVGLRAQDIPAISERAAHMEQLDQQILESGQPQRRRKETWRLPDGEQRILEVDKMPLRMDGNLINGILTMSADVTEDERVTRRLRETEERWKRALEVNDVGVWDFDVAAEQLVCSARWCELLQVKPSEQIRFPDFMVHPDDLPRYRSDWEALLEGRTEMLETAVRMRVADSYRFMKVRGKVVERDASGQALRVVGTHADIHDARQRQLQAATARKLEAIGQLAAGIAHEVNTPTQFVGDNVRFLKTGFDTVLACMHQVQRLARANAAVSSSELQACLQAADMDYLREEIPKAIVQSLDGIERIANIVGAMKEFSHPGQERAPTDINRAIANTITVATNEWKYVARVETAFDPRLPMVPVVAGEFNQVILNIIVNAAHAIGEAADRGESRMGTIRIATSQRGDCAEISIEDDGCGMSPEVQERIFDPFFTTKPVGKGTGQGLAIAHNVIVAKHGGTIEVKSKPGSGTTFVIRLPIKSQPMSEMAAA